MNAFIFLSEDSSKTPILYLDNPQAEYKDDIYVFNLY